MLLTKAELKDARAVASIATKGPWRGDCMIFTEEGQELLLGGPAGGFRCVADARFSTRARILVPTLLGHVRFLRWTQWFNPALLVYLLWTRAFGRGSRAQELHQVVPTFRDEELDEIEDLIAEKNTTNREAQLTGHLKALAEYVRALRGYSRKEAR